MSWALGGTPGVHSCLSYMQNNDCYRIPERSTRLKAYKILALKKKRRWTYLEAGQGLIGKVYI